MAISRQGGSVAQQGRSIARHRREITLMCDLITSGSRSEPRLSTLLALQRASIAKVTCHVQRGRVAALGPDAITGYLIALGGSLIAVGRGLVAVGFSLVGIRQRLILIGARLLVLAGYRICEKTARLFCLGRPVRRSHRMVIV